MIPCPFGCSHSSGPGELRAHIKVCPKRKQARLETSASNTVSSNATTSDDFVSNATTAAKTTGDQHNAVRAKQGAQLKPSNGLKKGLLSGRSSQRSTHMVPGSATGSSGSSNSGNSMPKGSADMQAQHTSRLVVLTHEDGRSRWRFASDYHDDVLRQAVVAMHADQGGAPRLSEMRRVQWAARAASVAAVTLGRDSAQFEHFLSRMGAGLEEAWLAAGRRLQANGYAVLEGFAGEEVARELRTSLAALYLKHGAEVEFSHGQIGGGRDGFGLDVRKNERIRGDRRAQLEVADERAPLLRCLFFCIDQVIALSSTLLRSPRPSSTFLGLPVTFAASSLPSSHSWWVTSPQRTPSLSSGQ